MEIVFERIDNLNISYIIQKCKTLNSEALRNRKKLDNYLGGKFSNIKDFERIFPALFVTDKSKIKHKRSNQLKQELFDYITEDNLVRAIDGVHKRKINDFLQQELIPAYLNFHRSQSREISYLPLNLRLYVYKELYKAQKTDAGRFEVLDRIATTLAKMNELDKAYMACAYQTFFIEDLDESLNYFFTMCKNLNQLFGMRKDILASQGYKANMAIDELSRSLMAFTNKKNFTNETNALIIFKLLLTYYPELSHDEEYINAVLNYFETDDIIEIKKLNIEQVDFSERLVIYNQITPNYRFIDAVIKKEKQDVNIILELPKQNFIQSQQLMANSSINNYKIIDEYKPKNFIEWLISQATMRISYRERLEQQKYLESMGLLSKQTEQYMHLDYIEGNRIEGYIDYENEKFIITYLFQAEEEYFCWEKEALITTAKHVVKCLANGYPFVLNSEDTNIAYTNPQQLEEFLSEIGFIYKKFYHNGNEQISVIKVPTSNMNEDYYFDYGEREYILACLSNIYKELNGEKHQQHIYTLLDDIRLLCRANNSTNMYRTIVKDIYISRNGKYSENERRELENNIMKRKSLNEQEKNLLKLLLPFHAYFVILNEINSEQRRKLKLLLCSIFDIILDETLLIKNDWSKILINRIKDDYQYVCLSNEDIKSSIENHIVEYSL